MVKRTIALVVIGLFTGAVIGGVLGNILGLLLPDGVVKDLFLTSQSFDLAGLVGKETGVIILDLKIITLKFGLAMSMNFTSIIGLTTAYYILRYFR